MKLEELNRDQLNELAGSYLCRLADEGVFAEVMGVDYDAPSYGDMADAIEIVPEDVMQREFGDICFTEDDFFCSANVHEEDQNIELGKCPACGDVYNVECCHETVDGDELLVWSECGNCGHQFIEVFKLVRIEEWKDRR